MHDAHLYLFVGQARQGVRQSFARPLHVGFDQQGESLYATLAHVFEHVFELCRLLFRQLDVAKFSLTEQRNLTRFALVTECHRLLARKRYIGQSLNFNRDRRSGLIHRLTGRVKHGAHAAEHGTSQQNVAAAQCARLHQYGSDRALALVQARFDHQPFGRGIYSGCQLQYLRLKQYLLEQAVYAYAGLGRHGNEG